MANRTHRSTTVIENYEVDAKSLRKGDSIAIGMRTYTVKSNVKDGTHRLLDLRWGTKRKSDAVFLRVPKATKFGVRNHQHTRHVK